VQDILFVCVSFDSEQHKNSKRNQIWSNRKCSQETEEKYYLVAFNDMKFNICKI